MSVSTKRLAELHKAFKAQAEALSDVDDPRVVRWDLVETLLRESLSPHMKRTLQFVDDRSAGEPTTSNDVAEHFGISIQFASTMLQKLHEYELLEREEIITTQGIYYEYN